MPTTVKLGQGGHNGVISFRAVAMEGNCVDLQVSDSFGRGAPLVTATMRFDEAIDLCRAILTEAGAGELAQILRYMKDGNEDDCAETECTTRSEP